MITNFDISIQYKVSIFSLEMCKNSCGAVFPFECAFLIIHISVNYVLAFEK